MQTLTPSFEYTDEERRELRWGVAGVAFVVVVLAICAAIYLIPLGKTTYTALLAEAESVQTGDDVRVAGISVGSVKGIELLPDGVRMRFTVARDVFVGDASRLEVRMLTAVGGHYIALLPGGSKPLGARPIPAERVTLPYSLMRVFDDAAAPLAQIDGDTLRRTVTALRQSLSDHPDSVRQLGDALNTLVGLLDRQRADVATALATADEYLRTIDSAKSTLGRLIRHIDGVENILIGKRDEINAALPLTIRLLSRIAALEPAYRTTLQPLADELARAMPDLQRLGEHLNQVITTLGDLTDRSAGLCVPLPGKGC
ncbi:MCE family protein [Nocardia terpenica]|uniref:MlaD family protein n=1 Tax=Nocardia terpenica TaxID=455432 RepID=UPI001893AD5D|nr:MlaD family protein [Nocardia terpenica]MBF6061962.1 MCE family protein [Nocardia terpenica]MBF6106238.1 MCE family protein [Nocardia terpenica]MBF6110382.1 MCE family protein [Nocardia terpenica]MBF6120781.1 MCE family protein [Nocardia terpenica]MBF6151718.1 MCE family protein [Nocardia terpenica]